MHRHLLFTSTQPPAVVLANLSTIGRRWRESEVPSRLRAFGIYGIRASITGDRFVLAPERTGRAYLAVYCLGTVRATSSGAVVAARLTQWHAFTPYLLVGGVYAIAAFLWLPPARALMQMIGVVVLLTFLLMVAFFLSGAEVHVEEAVELEALLKSAGGVIPISPD